MCPERDKWMEAMEKEMASLKANDVYDLVELPKDRKVLGSKWVYKRKVKADGSVERFKSRLVAQGLSQKLDKTMVKQRSVHSSGLNLFTQSLQWQFKMR